MFQDTARTVLPIEFQGREVQLQAHAYEDETASYQAMALVHRIENGKAELPIVRVHSGCITGDIFHSLRCDCYQQLQKALERITTSSHGVIIYLPHHEGRGIGLVNKIKAYAEQDRGLDTVDANLSIGAPVDARDYELAAKILKDLGCTQVRLLTNNPLKVAALEGYGVSVLEQVPHVIKASRYNARYLATKRERMSHKL
jgi:GTP cyclohydrolase II/3,4-dihydroxy 2-butanone 4-phosphate synthase/GTP cyclohydrolase II